jgi:hypothetical protein
VVAVRGHHLDAQVGVARAELGQQRRDDDHRKRQRGLHAQQPGAPEHGCVDGRLGIAKFSQQRLAAPVEGLAHVGQEQARGDDADSRAGNLLKTEFESLRGRIPGLLRLEVGIDRSRIGYACDAVLYSEFSSLEALAAYAEHPAHLRVKRALGNLRTARQQVDYETAAPGP